MRLQQTTSDLHIKLDMVTLGYVSVIVAPGNGVQSSTRLTAVRGKPIVGSAAKSIAASANSLEIERQRCKELQAQVYHNWAYFVVCCNIGIV